MRRSAEVLIVDAHTPAVKHTAEYTAGCNSGSSATSAVRYLDIDAGRVLEPESLTASLPVGHNLTQRERCELIMERVRLKIGIRGIVKLGQQNDMQVIARRELNGVTNVHQRRCRG